jgi:hypothetical protein
MRMRTFRVANPRAAGFAASASARSGPGFPRSGVPAPAPTGSIALLSLLLVASPALGYELNIVVWADDELPLPISLRPEGTRDTPIEDLEPIVGAAIDSWNAVSCSYMALDFQGVEELPIAIDEDQVIGWEDDAEAWIYGSQSAGATIIDVLGDDGPRVDILFNDVNFDWVEDANTFVTPDYEFGVDPPLELDPQSVISHELGHLIGLAHPIPTDESSQPDGLATMVFALLPNAQQRSLAGDDKAGLCAKYFVDVDECDADGDECGEGEYCRSYEIAEETVWLCDEERGTFGDFCGRDDFNCHGICLFSEADYSEGICSEYCDEHIDCPQEPDEWSCRSLATTAGGNVEVCWPEPPEDNGGGPHSGFEIGIVNADPEPGPELEPDVGVEPDLGSGDVESGDVASAEVPGDTDTGCACSRFEVRGSRFNGLLWLFVGVVILGARRRG